MKKMILIISLLSLIIISFQIFANEMEESVKIQSKTKFEKLDTLINDKISEKSIQYSVIIEKTDSLEYKSINQKIKTTDKNILKITNFNEAKKMLNGVVEFSNNADFGENQNVKKIYFRNGEQYENSNELDDCFFVEYFPEEDILLCEGGHTTDLSFNLKNGKKTEETGNPNIIKTSPKNEFRLNGHFGGQVCYSYFIQRKINNEYVKIIQLDEEFKKLTKDWLCEIGESFWFDEKTLYLTKVDFLESGISKQYLKIKIIEK